MNASFVNPDDEALRGLLRRAKTVAVMGFSPKSNHPSHAVAAAMQRFGYRIIPVRPMLAEGLGEKAWPDLASIPNAGEMIWCMFPCARACRRDCRRLHRAENPGTLASGRGGQRG